jgi:lipopolysaccharide heptosyltransferase II
MFESWAGCQNILCIRADNMGDLVMSSPAIRALKETFHARLTVLTSSMAAGIARHIPEIDETITYDLPWVKTKASIGTQKFFQLVEELKSRDFDAAVIFSVYSQNPLPAVMLAYLADIPNRLAYCRENPYELLTHWVPDKEPYSVIKHQVRRDLDLVKQVGAFTTDDRLSVNNPLYVWETVKARLLARNIDLTKPYVLLHAGVSEKKREYPFNLWVETARRITHELQYPVLFTGAISEKQLADRLQQHTGERSCAIAGLLSLEEFITLISHASLVISVNTATIHLAAAVNTPVITLYALTNPQHFPWRAKGKVLVYDVPEEIRSRNEVIRYVNEQYFSKPFGMVDPEEIISAAIKILGGDPEPIPEMMMLSSVNDGIRS